MPGLLDTLLGQEPAVATLRRALAADKVHHAYVFDGPDGVGKEMAAFGLAQALLCERRGTTVEGARGLFGPEPPTVFPTTEACGTCSACTRALLRPGEKRPVHPDLVVLERGLYEASQIGRRTPETQDISVDQVRTLVLARAAFGPHEGRAKVFIVRRAEELGISAANALLKTLEEPGNRVHFLLLSSVPDRLLPTIRSRTQRLRFAPLPAATVAKILEKEGKSNEEALRLSARSEGSLARARQLGDPAATATRDEFVARARDALGQNSILPALAIAEEGKKEKAELGVLLDALAIAFAEEGRAAALAGEGDVADRAAVCFSRVLRATRELDRNASPQLTVEALFLELRG
jgi:DNA polymerase-3 subunit delta'